MFSILSFPRQRTFCVRAYKSASITPNGEIHVCCTDGPTVSVDARPMSIYEFSITEIMNSPCAHRTRKKIVSGRNLPGCIQCWEMESAGFESRRMRLNRAWEKGYLNSEKESIAGLLGKIKKAKYTYDRIPIDWQLSFGNTCNLRCRFCRADYSSSVDKDIVQKKWIPAPPESSILVENRFQNQQSWFQQKQIYQELFDDTFVDRRLNILGGEPMVTKELKDLLDFIIAKGHAPKTKIIITTNGTVVDEEICKKLANFAEVQIGISLDAIGELLHYIRYPSRWPIVEENIYKYSHYDGIDILINPTLCVYNIFNIIDVAEFAHKNNYMFYVNILKIPDFLCIDLLPNKILALANDKIRNFKKNTSISENIAKEIEKTINYISLAQQKNNLPARDKLLNEFMLFTNDVDRSRGQNFQNTVHELYENLTTIGIHWNSSNRFIEEALQEA